MHPFRHLSFTDIPRRARPLKTPFLVGVCRCSSYEPHGVQEAVRIAMDRSGGGPILQGNVLLKANLLAPVSPERSVTTHPSVLAGLASWVRTGRPEAEITVSDSPGYIFSGQWPSFVENCGLRTLIQENSCSVVPLNEDGYRDVYQPKSFVQGNLRIPVKVAEAGTLINVAKCKTHVETEITACLKNTFGYLDTSSRKRAHRSGSLRSLCNAVLDAHLSRVPDWNLLDAVVGMEGNGPSHGKPIPMGWIVASQNALAADVIAAFMMGYADPFSIPLLAAAAERAMGPASMNEIELAGAAWEDLPVNGFRKASSTLRRFIPTPLRGAAHAVVRLSPAWDLKSCTFCGACEAVCPVKAIRLQPGEVVIDRALCVRCLCCHEMCPTGAMNLKPNFIARLLLKK